METNTFDYILGKGNIIDGTGKNSYVADIGIVNGLPWMYVCL